MGMLMRLLNTVLGPITYPVEMTPLHTDNFNRANGDLSAAAPYIHHNITSQRNRIVDGVLVGPATSYSFDTIDIRVPNHRGYIKARVPSTEEAMMTSGQSRLNFHAGRNSTPPAAYSFQSVGLNIQASSARLYFFGLSFRQGWPGDSVDYWVNTLQGVANQFRPGDEFCIFWEGLRVWIYWNGVSKGYTITVDQWTPGYFTSIALDAGRAFDELEMGYWGSSGWIELGDNFRGTVLDQLWNVSTIKPAIVDQALQGDPSFATANGTFASKGLSKLQSHDDFLIGRAIIKAPFGVTAGGTIATYILGRCGTDVAETTPHIAFGITASNGAVLATVVGTTITNRNVATSAQVGALTYPVEIELQCIGNRYFGLVNGNPVCEWRDTGNLVAIGVGRRGYGWITQLVRSGTTYTYGPAIDAVVLNALTSDRVFGVPELYGVSPSSIPLAGGTWLQVTGSNLNHVGRTLTVGGVAITDLTNYGTNVLGGPAPAMPAGTYDVKVTTPLGEATLVGAVTYVAPPSFNHMGMGKTSQTTAPNSWSDIPGWVIRSGFPATNIVSNGMVMNGTATVSVVWNIPNSIPTWVQYRLMKNGVVVWTGTVGTSSGTIPNIPVVSGDVLKMQSNHAYFSVVYINAGGFMYTA